MTIPELPFAAVFNNCVSNGKICQLEYFWTCVFLIILSFWLLCTNQGTGRGTTFLLVVNSIFFLSHIFHLKALLWMNYNFLALQAKLAEAIKNYLCSFSCCSFTISGWLCNKRLAIIFPKLKTLSYLVAKSQTYKYLSVALRFVIIAHMPDFS